MKKKLLKAKDTLVENALRKIEAGEVSEEIYHIIINELSDIELNERTIQMRKDIVKILSKEI